MPKEQSIKRVSKPPRNGARVNGAFSNGRATSERKRTLPVIQDAAVPRPLRQSGTSETQLRYWLASLVRLSDNIVLKAVHAYNKIFELKTEDQADIYLEMAREFERDGKTEEVLEALRKAVALRPDDGKIRLQIGLLHLKAKAPAAAIQAFQKAKELGYSSYRLHVSLAQALVRQKELDQALTEYQQALALRPESPEALHKMGLLLDQLGRFQDAVLAFQKAVELDPGEVLYHQSLGFALESAGRRSEAVKCFKRALELEHQEQHQLQQEGAE
jgi:tetratricopeptide (TPR) repeat protein